MSSHLSHGLPHGLRGVSAASLETVLAAVDASSGAADDLGRELFGAAAALDGSPALRRVLTDPSTEDAAKAGLASTVFGPAVSPATLEVLSAAVTNRWTAGRDLADGLETAGVVALVKAAEAAGNLDTVETELFEVGRLVVDSPELRRALSDTVAPGAGKAELLGSLLEGKVAPATVAIARQAAVARGASFERKLDGFADLVAARRGRLLAEVRTATELAPADQERLAAALTGRYGRPVHLNVIVDPSIVGGLSVSVADDVIDGTMSSRLEAARRRLAG